MKPAARCTRSGASSAHQDREVLIRAVHLSYSAACKAGRGEDAALKRLLRFALELGYPASGLTTLANWQCPDLSEAQLRHAAQLRQSYGALGESSDTMKLNSAEKLPWVVAIELARAWKTVPGKTEQDAFMDETFSAWSRHAEFENRGYDKLLGSLARACMADPAARTPLELTRLHLRLDSLPGDELDGDEVMMAGELMPDGSGQAGSELDSTLLNPSPGHDPASSGGGLSHAA